MVALNQLEFKISTGLKSIIGKELITSNNIAIFELVKNSYDANAKKVEIVFLNAKGSPKDSRILVIDNGDGMSKEDIEQKWLFVGYSEKKPNPENPEDYRNKIAKRKRIFAGAKGIGRFSADRLGKRLDLFTKKTGESGFHHLSVDWTKFDNNQTKQFQTIMVPYSEEKILPIQGYEIKAFQKGTILEISGLNERWDEKRLIDLKRYLQRLVNPSEEQNKDEFSIILEAKEFVENDVGKGPYEAINGPVKNVVFEKLDIKTTRIETHIKDGKIRTELNDKGRYVFSFEEDNPYNRLDDIHIRVFFLNQEAKTSFTRIMGLEAYHYGSIFLYKNGFRIHPLGSEGDDWLGIDRRKAQGYARYLGSREIIGRVEIYGLQPEFQEVSSRAGGVVETEAYHQLRKLFIEKVLIRLEKYVVKAIDWDSDTSGKRSETDVKVASIKLIKSIVGPGRDTEKTIDFNPDLVDIVKERQLENIGEIVRNIEHVKASIKSPKLKNYVDKQLKSFRTVTASIIRENKQKDQALEVKTKESMFLTRLVSQDSETIVNLNHTIGNSTLKIKNYIRKINHLLNNSGDNTQLKEYIDKISMENEKIIVLSNLVTSANFNKLSEKAHRDVVAYIKEYVGLSLSGDKEDLKFHFQNADVSYVLDFSPLEVSIVLDNFITNSRKNDATSVIVRFTIQNKELHIFFADDGRGVKQENEKFLFTRGYTTTSGSGLGLYHVKNIIESMGGRIRFAGNNFNKLGRGACFEVIIG